MSTIFSSHILASNGGHQILPPIGTTVKNVRLIIEVQHELSVHSAAASLLFDGSSDALPAAPGVSAVITGAFPGYNRGEKKPLIYRLTRKFTRKVIPRLRKWGTQALFGRKKATLLEKMLEVIPEESGAPEASELSLQAESYITELIPNGDPASGTADTLIDIEPSSSLTSEISTHPGYAKWS
ncbi:MAG: hypothetical protein M1813_008082 [Trichoglossum hirsutum]|nr:MAG: hypothetical protein M1813_008082 [Trichoglossum hirsutum]